MSDIAIQAIRSVDSLLEQAGYSPDSSVRHQLSIALSDLQSSCAVTAGNATRSLQSRLDLIGDIASLGGPLLERMNQIYGLARGSADQP